MAQLLGDQRQSVMGIEKSEGVIVCFTNPPPKKRLTESATITGGGVEDWRPPPYARLIKETQQLIQKAQRLLLSAEHHIRESQRMIREEGGLL